MILGITIYIFLNDVDRFNIGVPGCASRVDGGGRPIGGGGDRPIGGGAGDAGGAGVDEVVIHNFMTQETRTKLNEDPDVNEDWIIATMGFGSEMDNYLLSCIQALITSRGGDTKQVVFVGQAYFILQSLFFTNSTLIFIDVNIHLLNAMRNIINNFKNIQTFNKLFNMMEILYYLRLKHESQQDLQKVKEILEEDDEGILFQRCKQNFLTNTYVLCEAGITDEPLLDYLNSYRLDYFSITNLHAFDISNFWETINRLQTYNPELLFLASDRVAVHQYIFQYDSSQLSVFTTDNPNIFNFKLEGANWMDMATQFYSQYDFVKYVYVVRNVEPIIFKNIL